MLRILFLTIFLIVSSFTIGQVLPGVGQVDLYRPLLAEKRVAVVANSASVINRINTVDTLLSLGINVIRIFSPEHGFREFQGAGEEVADIVDQRTRLPVVSLYGAKKKPSMADLTGIDIIVFDIQDVGVRFYTYISTLTYIMEAVAEAGIPIIVFDRPNPNGFFVDGPLLEKEYTSFVGLHPVPVVYGMTIGEYAQMVNGEAWMKDSLRADLTVIPCAEYTHSALYDIPSPPSPNLTSMNAIWLYPSLCLFEGTVMSVGRGTCFPFETFGHPDLKGFSFSFIPEKIPGMSLDPPFLGKKCFGLDLRNFYTEKPKLKGRLNLAWILMSYANMYHNPDFFTPYFDQLAGNATLRKQIIQGVSEQEIRASWNEGLNRFMTVRAKYLIYP